MGRLFKKQLGRNLKTSSQRVYKIDTEASHIEIEQNNVSNNIILTVICYNPFLWNQDELYSNCSFIGMKYSDLICSVYPMKNIYFLEKITKKTWLNMSGKKVIRAPFLFHSIIQGKR